MGLIRLPDVDPGAWTCAGCDEKLTPRPVELEYLDSLFNVELPACPSCGMVYIPEGLALGKMLQVEQLLEDK